MRTRNKGYMDYGLTDSDAKRLKVLAKKQENERLVHECAEQANKQLAAELYYSLVKGVSYEKLDSINRIDIDKGSFYGYQRKTLAILGSRI